MYYGIVQVVNTKLSIFKVKTQERKMFLQPNKSKQGTFFFSKL